MRVHGEESALIFMGCVSVCVCACRPVSIIKVFNTIRTSCFLCCTPRIHALFCTQAPPHEQKGKNDNAGRNPYHLYKLQVELIKIKIVVKKLESVVLPFLAHGLESVTQSQS